MIKYNILFRACDKVEISHRRKRPFGLNKKEVIKVSFYSMYKSLQGYDYSFTVIGDDLSEDMLKFFESFEDIKVINDKLGSGAASLQKQLELAKDIKDDEWIYLCEDDYLHIEYSFKYIDEFIKNKEQILKTSKEKKNYMNFLIGDLSKKPLIIHSPDYPDRYKPAWKRLSFVFLSKYCHWRSISNTTHTILLQSSTLKKYRTEFDQSAIGPSDAKLSKKVYGRIWFFKRALCVSPILGLSTHMTEHVMTPLVDWENICYNNIEKLKEKGLWID